MTPIQIVILAVIQGLTELLPVSSSAHVIAAAKLMDVDPTTPQFTLLLVMLHTGTMFAVIVYFWRAWKRAFFSSREQFKQFATHVVVATAITGVIAMALKFGIEAYFKHQHPGIAKVEIEQLFKHLELIALGLAAAGLLILYSGLHHSIEDGADAPDKLIYLSGSRFQRFEGRENITTLDSIIIGAVQGLCLPFRGFSRSGATISTGLLRGVARIRLEEFSFALAVVITPAVILYEAHRLIQHHGETTASPIGLAEFTPSLLGMVFSFFGGLVALKILSGLLERGKWWVFGIYCLIASAGVFGMYLAGY